MSANNNNLPPVIKYRTYSGEYSNTFDHEWIWSLKRGKWVKGRCHKGGAWGCDYYLLPGVYALFRWSGFLDERGAELTVKKLYLSEEKEQTETIVTVTLPKYELKDIVKNDPDAPEALKDFIKGAPAGYHTVADDPPADKTYQAGEFEKVIAYIKTLPLKVAEE